MVYGISQGNAVGPSGLPMGEPMHGGMKLLATESCGGFRLFQETADSAAAMAAVADELHHQYLLAFEPASLDGKEHRLDVRVKRPGMSAIARRSYVAKK